MFVPILSTLLLLDVSVSSTSNSSTVQHEDPIVFVRHLNGSLPSANSSLTVDEGELESYDDSAQDNIRPDESDGEIRIFSFIKNWISPHPYSKLVHVNDGDPLMDAVRKAGILLSKKKLRKREEEWLSNTYIKMLHEASKGDSRPFADVSFSILLITPTTSQLTQNRFLESKTKISAIFELLMLQVQDESLKGFFSLHLQNPLLSYATKMYEINGDSEFRLSVADDLTNLLTAKRNGGSLITWLGTCECDTSNINSLIQGLSRHPTTLNLAYRLHALRSSSFIELFGLISSYPFRDINPVLDYVAYVRFNFIEHEAKSSAVVVPNLHKFLKSRGYKDEVKLKVLFSEYSERISTSVNQPLYHVYTTSILNKLNEGQVRLLKAAVQSNYHAGLVKEALEAYSQVAESARMLGGQEMEDTIKALLDDEKLMQRLQEVLKDKRAVQLLQANSNDVMDLEHLPLPLKKDGVEIKEENDEVVTNLLKLITNRDTLQPLNMFAADNERVTRLTNVIERFKLLDDMLSSTELDTVSTLEAILVDQDKVSFLKEAMKDDQRLKLFKEALEDKKKIDVFRNGLGDNNLRMVFDQVIKDMNQVFSLRVAIKDDDRVRFFRAALEDKKQVEEFVNALNQKKLANIFRSILKEEKQVDREMLAAEMLEYLKSLDEVTDRSIN
ncbi:hypothetical protein Plhal703r1_c18g0082201 [Plasmopara halstedii]